jgi:alpha-L-rhamnosidase
MTTPLAPTDLTVNDRSGPLGVEGAPLFGWRPAERQTAYQIRVCAPGDEDSPIWEDGPVESARTAFVRYGGPALTAETTYTWSVRTRHGDGRQSPWADAAAFDTGVGEWQAWWIRRTTAERDDYTLARTEFPAGTVQRARLYLSATHQYRAYLNGRQVDTGPAFAYPDEGYYQVTDITADLREDNAFGVLYHWYGPGQGRPEGEPGLIARIVVDHEDGTRQVVVSDGSWRVTRGPWREAQWRNDDGRDYIEHGDGHLARALQGWAAPGFDDSGWQRAEETEPPRLRAQLTRLRHTVVEPVGVTALPSGAVVADFGTVIPAVPRVRFDSTEPGTVSLVAGYVLDAGGNVSNTLHDNQVTDLSYTYETAGGTETFEAFTYVGFRYLQVGVPAQIAAVVQHTDADPARRATFRSSDPTLDAVFALLQRSALYSTQEQFLDTPTREKGQFLADAATISRALMAGWGDRAVTARAIREIAASQARYWPDGRLNAVYPNGDGKRDIPDFTAMFPGWVWDYYLASGDAATLAETYPVCVAVADYVRRYRDESTGLVTRLAGGGGAYEYGIIDWPNRYGYDTAVAARTTVNILAVDVLRATARQAAALGRPQAEADALTADADALTTAINERLRRPDGVYLDGLGSVHASQIANAYAIAYGVAPPADHKTIADHLASMRLRMGPMVADVLLTALHRAGRDDEVLARLTDASALGWANILARGGTFTWESWEAPETGESLSHGWGSAALVPLLQSLLGVTVTAPAAAALRIAPPTGTSLRHAAGTIWTQAGPVTVEWTTDSLTVDLPPNVTAQVHVPGGPREAGPGRSSFTW